MLWYRRKEPSRMALLMSVALLLGPACGSTVPWEQLQLELQEERVSDQAAREVNRTPFLRPLWYVGPGVPLPGTAEIRAEIRSSGSLFEGFLGALLPSPSIPSTSKPESRSPSGPPNATRASFGLSADEEWLRGRERPWRWIVLAPAPGAGVADRTALAEALLLLRKEHTAGRVPDPRCGLAVLSAPLSDQRVLEIEAQGEEIFALVEFSLAGLSRRAEVGAPESILILERSPDPGARIPIQPDETYGWSWPGVLPSGYRPDGASLVARCALVDAGEQAGQSFGDRPAVRFGIGDRPWRGDRPELGFARLGLGFAPDPGFVAQEPGESSEPADWVASREYGIAALLTVGFALADAGAGDLERYLEAGLEELRVRWEAADQAGRSDLATDWEAHRNESVSWLRKLCLGLREDDAESIIRGNPPELGL